MDDNNKRNRILAIICFVAFFICAIWLAKYFINQYKANKELEDMKAQVVNAEQTNDEAANDADNTASELAGANSENADETEADFAPGRVLRGIEEFEGADKSVDFKKLKEQNEDIYSWITVPGTLIDYPIVQDPDELDYYLNHNLDHSAGYPGCIYTQNLNSTNWEDNNTVIYGHNMKNGTMFAALHSYRDPEFLKTNPYVYIFTPDETRVYQIFAAYEVSDAHLLLTYNTEDQDSFGWYLEGIMDNEETLTDHYDTSLDLNSYDKIISLETCISTKPTMRWLVQAVLVARADHE